MPTFLSNSKMSPQLAARIERSLGSRGRSSHLRPGMIALLRVATVSTIVACVLWMLNYQQTQREELERAQSRLLTTLQRQSGALTRDSDELVSNLNAWLIESAGAYGGDVFVPELRSQNGWAELLKRPAIYVRGPIDAFGTSDQIGAVATESQKDALLLCLLDPPPARDEKSLLENVRTAYRGEGAMDRAGHVQRLYAALAGLPVLSPRWAERVAKAEDVMAVAKLEELHGLAPIEQAQLADRAELFIFALDEPNEPGAPSEFDGAARHRVRVHIVDLRESRVLLRVRRQVDPAWISEKARHRYARGLDACRLAFDVREAVLARTP